MADEDRGRDRVEAVREQTPVAEEARWRPVGRERGDTRWASVPDAQWEPAPTAELVRPAPPGFDHVLAALAADACERLATSVDAEAAERMAGTASLAAWEGGHRMYFDDRLARHTGASTDTSAALRRLAGDLRDAADTARLDERRRADAEWTPATGYCGTPTRRPDREVRR